MEMTPDLAARQLLMSAYLYYRRDAPVLSDADNDWLSMYVVGNWDKIPERYKPLLLSNEKDYTVLLTTTSHCRYTRQVEGGALAWLNVKKKGKKLERLGYGYYEAPNDISDLI
ncbi:MAG: hypothetical protein V3U75_13480 [Methylococcaceae bacterium]